MSWAAGVALPASLAARASVSLEEASYTPLKLFHVAEAAGVDGPGEEGVAFFVRRELPVGLAGEEHGLLFHERLHDLLAEALADFLRRGVFVGNVPLQDCVPDFADFDLEERGEFVEGAPADGREAVVGGPQELGAVGDVLFEGFLHERGDVGQRGLGRGGVRDERLEGVAGVHARFDDALHDRIAFGGVQDAHRVQFFDRLLDAREEGYDHPRDVAVHFGLRFRAVDIHADLGDFPADDVVDLGEEPCRGVFEFFSPEPLGGFHVGGGVFEPLGDDLGVAFAAEERVCVFHQVVLDELDRLDGVAVEGIRKKYLLLVADLVRVVERHLEGGVFGFFRDLGLDFVVPGLHPGLPAVVFRFAERGVALDGLPLPGRQLVEELACAAPDVARVDADFLHVAVQRDRAVDLRLDVVHAVERQVGGRVRLALQGGDAHVERGELALAVEQVLDVVVGGDLLAVFVQVGVFPGQVALEFVFVEFRRAVDAVRVQHRGEGRGQFRGAVEVHLPVGVDLEVVADHGARAELLQRGLRVFQAGGEIGHEVLFDLRAHVLRDFEGVDEEGVVERVGALLLDVRLEDDDRAPVVAVVGVGGAGGEILGVERAVHRAVFALERGLGVFGEEAPLHLVAELQVARAVERQALLLLGLEGVDELRVRLLEERYRGRAVAAPAHDRAEVHVDRQLVAADHVADLLRVHLVHAALLEDGVGVGVGAARHDGAFRGRAHHDAEVERRHVLVAAEAVGRRLAAAAVALHEARDVLHLVRRRARDGHAARDLRNHHRLDAAEVRKNLLGRGARVRIRVGMRQDARALLLQRLRFAGDQPLVDVRERIVVEPVDGLEQVLFQQLRLPVLDHDLGGARLVRRACGFRLRRHHRHFAGDIDVQRVEVAHEGRGIHLATGRRRERGERRGGRVGAARPRVADLRGIEEALGQHLVRADLREVHRCVPHLHAAARAQAVVGELDELAHHAGRNRAARLHELLQRVAGHLPHRRAEVLLVGVEERVRRRLERLDVARALGLGRLQLVALHVEQAGPVRLGGDGAERIDVDGHGMLPFL